MVKTENGQPAIRVRDLHKSFDDLTVLDGISLTVDKGESVGVLGRSGTGKSVLLKLIIGLQKPDSGSIEIIGDEITRLPSARLNEIRKGVGFLFQYSALYDSLTVEENVAFSLRRHTDMTAGQRRERVRELLSRVGMEDASAKLPAEISGGMKKRVGLARALALEPHTVLLDEPTAGLDPITAGEIDELFRGLQQERKISSIVVTHDMHCAKTVCDRVALLQDGHFLVEGDFEALEKSNDKFVSEFLRQSF